MFQFWDVNLNIFDQKIKILFNLNFNILKGMLDVAILAANTGQLKSTLQVADLCLYLYLYVFVYNQMQSQMMLRCDKVFLQGENLRRTIPT